VSERLDYIAEMGKEPPSGDPETERQFSYRPRKDVSPLEFLQGDPGDEQPDVVIEGQESLL
jgi:hypothetical protein